VALELLVDEKIHFQRPLGTHNRFNLN
jgi:hypothetical protein